VDVPEAPRVTALVTAAAPPDASATESKAVAAETVAPSTAAAEIREPAAPPAAEAASPDFVLSAGLEPPQSWIRANIFVVVVLLLVAAGVAATILLH
jgi:hypothetical protein